MIKTAINSAFNSIIKTFCVMLMFVTSSQIALADATLTYQATNGNYNFQLKNQRLLIKNIDTDTDLIYDQTANHAIVIQHQKKNYLVLNEAELKRLNQQISGLKSSITENLSSNQRDQLNQFLGGALGSDTPKATSTYSIKNAGGAQVGNFLCQQYQVLENSRASGSICTASAQQLQLNSVDYNTLMAFQRFAIKASNILGDSISSMTQTTLPDLSKTPINEFLIFSKIEKQSEGDFFLKNINQNTINNNIAIPNNYKQATVSAASLIR